MRRLFLTCLCITMGWGLFPQVEAQSLSDTTTISEYKEQVRQLMSYLEFTFNAIGDSLASAREKEIMIGQSYQKIFRDARVQVEDDLTEYRSTVTNKDVQAYLKDIDFFFKHVEFEFLVNEISHEVNDKGDLYFKVGMDRVLKGINIDGDTMNHVQPRFVELNLDPETRVLKIASIYTTRLSEEEDLANWWNQLPFDWKAFFADEISVTEELTMSSLISLNDTIGVGDTILLENGEFLPLNTKMLFAGLKRVIQMETIDLSDNPSVTDLEPLSKLTRLREVNISGTIVTDLVPLRNLTRLEVLKCGNTKISDLQPLRYAVSLKEIIAGNCRITDLSPLRNFPQLTRLEIPFTSVKNIDVLRNLTKLRELYLDNTWINDISPLSSLNNLENLDISSTTVNNLSPLKGLENLQTIHLEQTPVFDLSPLADCKALRLIFADGTSISNLEPLAELQSLRKIYCDKTSVTRTAANQFMRKRPDCLVIYDSATLLQWWQNLSADWKKVFSSMVPVSGTPEREELHQVAGINRIDINNHPVIKNLEPLQMLTNLEELHCAFTGVDTLGPLADLVQLKVLDVSFTRINSLAPLRYLSRLEELNCSHTRIGRLGDLAGLSNLEWLDMDHTEIEDLSDIAGLTKLRHLYCDSTGVSSSVVRTYLLSNPDCLVIFKSEELEKWWNMLPAAWQRVLRSHGRVDQVPDREQLHQIVSLEGVSITDNQGIRDLIPLKEFLRLNTLKVTNAGVMSLEPLSRLISLQVLDCSQNPLQDLGPLSELKNITYLNIENTPVEDLSPVMGLINLKEMVCAGTQVKDLKDLESLYKLEILDCSNSDIRNLNGLENLKELKFLKCFNTRLNDRKVEKFKEENPSCEVIYY